MSKRRIRNYSILAVILIVALLFFLIPSWRGALVKLIHLNHLSEIHHFVDSMGPWGPIVMIALMILHSVTFIPFEVILFADLVLFGPVWGVVYSWVGLMLGAYLSFILARAFGRPVVEHFVSWNMVERFDGFVKRDGVKGLLVLRLIPFLSFNALNYAAGLTSLSVWKFLWTTAVGVLPLNLLFALVYRSSIGQKYALIGLTVAGITLLVVWVIRAVRSHRKGTSHQESGHEHKWDQDECKE